MNKFIIDAYAWVEYFIGSELGNKVKIIIENKDNEIYTNIITIAELSRSYKRDSLDFIKEKALLLNASKIVYIDIDFADEAGKLNVDIKKEGKKHMSMADVFVLLSAKKLNAKVVTGDEDFRGLKDVIMIK